MKEMWEILTPENWLKNHVAMDCYGRTVLPNDPSACRFSIIGSLIHCYLEPGELWSPLFEAKRSKIVHGIVATPKLRHIVQKNLKYTTLTKLPLGELNSRVEVDFIVKLIQVLHPSGA